MNTQVKRQINELVAQIEVAGQRSLEAEQAKQISCVQLGGLIKQMPIQDVVELMPPDTRPTLVSVEKPGRPLVMMIPKQAPNFGVLVWADQWYPGSTGAYLTFNSGVLESSPFYMPCGCCCFNSDETIQPLEEFNKVNPNPHTKGGSYDFIEEKKEWDAKWKRFKKETLQPLYVTLHETIAKVSKERDVHHVFVRSPEKWEVIGKTPGLLMMEGNEFYSSITKWYGETDARSFFSYWKARR